YLSDIDKEPSAGFGHGAHGRHLPERKPQGLHRVGHHLLMPDRDVDVVLAVVYLRDWKQRCDRSTLDDLEVVVDQAPLDILRSAEVRFDLPAQLYEPNDLFIRQRRLPLVPGFDRVAPNT